MYVRYTLLFCLCFIGSSIKPAHAEKKQIGVYPFQSGSQGVSRQTLKNMSQQLLSFIEQSGRYKVIQQYPLQGGKAPVAASTSDATLKAQEAKALAPLIEQIETAKKAMKAGNFDKAIKDFKKSIRLGGVRLIHWPSSMKHVFDTYANLAFTYFNLGENDKGELWIRRLAILKPNPVPTVLTKYRQMKFIWKRQARRIPAGTNSLKISGTTGTKVYLDGQFRGRVPLTVSGLSKGFHYLQAQKKGYEYYGKPIRIKSGEINTLSMLLKQRQAKKTSTPISRANKTIRVGVQTLVLDSSKFTKAVRAICLHTDSQIIVSAQFTKTEDNNYLMTPIRIDCDKQIAESQKAVRIDPNLPSLTPLMQKGLDTLILGEKKGTKVIAVRKRPIERRPIERRPVERRPDPFERPIERSNGDDPKVAAAPVYKKWWFWTILGAAAVGGGVTAAVLATQPPKVGVSAEFVTE